MMDCIVPGGVRTDLSPDGIGRIRGLLSRLEATRNDVLRVYINQDRWAALPVKDFMQRDIPVVSPQTLLIDAARLMVSQRARQVVVALDEAGKLRPVAMLTDADLAYHLVKSG